MSLIIQAGLFDRYGARLDAEALAAVLDKEPKTVRNLIAANRLGIPTYVDGGKRWADVRDVAAYFDQQREKAEA